MDELRLLPEPDAEGDYVWPGGSMVWKVGAGWRWMAGDLRSEDSHETPLAATLAMIDVSPGCGPSPLAVARHRHPPTTAAEAMAWAVLAGDDAAAWELADALQIDRARPEGARTQGEQIEGYRSVLLLTLKTLSRVRRAMLPGLTAGLTPAAVLALDGVLLEESAFIGSFLAGGAACASGSTKISASPSPAPAA